MSTIRTHASMYLLAGLILLPAAHAQTRLSRSVLTSGTQTGGSGAIRARSFVGFPWTGSASSEHIRLLGGPAQSLLFSSTTAVEDNGTVPAEYALEQNFPNPFNPSTTIRFDLPQAEHVSVVLYSLLGQQVRVLVNEQREAGRHSVVWNGMDDAGRHMPSGTYIYRMNGGHFSRVRKLLLLR